MRPCYVCGQQEFTTRPGHLRDAPDVGVVECVTCGLVVPDRSPQELVDYRAGTMHGGTAQSLEQWRADCRADDVRRCTSLLDLLQPDDVVLDVGCGAGGFLQLLAATGVRCIGVELDAAAVQSLTDEGLSVVTGVDELTEEERSSITIVTMFHVLEHLVDPRTTLREISRSVGGARLFVFEVPCSEDPLLTVFPSQEFSEFTYWSHHEHLHSRRSLEQLLSEMFRTVSVRRLQRYGLRNHLGWLVHGRPGGLPEREFLDDEELSRHYRRVLEASSSSDSLWAEAADPILG